MEHIDSLVTCQDLNLKDGDLLPADDGTSALECGLIFLDVENMDTLCYLTCWLSPGDSE